MNAISLLINVTLLLAVLDSVWSPILGMEEADCSFIRVGSVDSTSVKILGRIPPVIGIAPGYMAPVTSSNSTEDELEIENKEELDDSNVAARIAFRTAKPLGKWNMGPEFRVQEGNDWTGLAKIEGLWSSTEYEFRLLDPTTGSHHPLFPNLRSFKTAPDPALSSNAFSFSAPSPGMTGGSHFKFASTSCIKPGFPYTGPSGKRDLVGARYLLKEAEAEGLDFGLFLGDFIYADTPFYPGDGLASYQKRYRQTFASPDLKALVEKLPLISIMDDHEIFNDFSANTSSPMFAPATAAFHSYLGAGNPTISPSLLSEISDLATEPINYFDYQYGDAAFFFLDTRAYRSPNSMPDEDGKTMLGEKQRQAFFEWVDKVNSTVTFKFIVSSVPFMTLWGKFGSDTFAGFVHERDILLDVLEWVPNVIVLSGDRHEFAAASLRDSILEFSTSPLSQFYVPLRTLSQSNGRGATGEDKLLKYLPDGNSKFSTFEVDTRTPDLPVVRVKVVIDGEEAWRMNIVGKPLERPTVMNTSLGHLGKSLRELLGFQVRKWFN